MFNDTGIYTSPRICYGGRSCTAYLAVMEACKDKDKVGADMARRCDICGKGTIVGNNVPRKGLAKKKGGVGQHIGVKTKRVFKPNIVAVKALIDGTPRTIKVCTRCLRSGRVQKVV